MKTGTGRSRPLDGGDSDEFDPLGGAESFPSGHTTVAFAVATALSEDLSNRFVAAGLYTAAGLTVFARVHDDKHWLSDAVAGAVLGHLVGRWVTRRHGEPLIELGPGGAVVSVRF